MRILSLILLISISAGMAKGQSPYQYALNFGDTAGLYGVDNGRLELTTDDGFIIMETRRQINVKDEFVILKSDSALNLVYTTRLIRPYPPGGQGDSGGDVLPLPDGGFLFTNHVLGPTPTTPGDIALLRFDNQGALIYHRQYDNVSSLFPFNLKYFAQDSILLGFRAGGRFGYMMANENGDPLHIRLGYYSGIASYGNSGIIRTSDNHILNFAEAYWNTSPVDKPQLALVKYDPDGNLQWAYRYADTLFHYFIHDGIELANGNFLFCGMRQVNGNTGGYGTLFCVSPTGQFLWSKYFNPAPLTFKKLTLIAPDTILVSGFRTNPYYGLNLLVDSTGTILYGSGYNAGFQAYENYHLTVSNSDREFISVSGLSVWGGTSIILSKSYPSNYNHCTNNPVLPSATPVTGFTQYSDFIASNLTLTDIPPTRTYTYDNTMPAVTLHCTSTGISETGDDPEPFFAISPNPGNGTFIIKIPPAIKDVPFEILNPAGQLILKGVFAESESTLHLNGYSSGIYLLKGYFKNSIVYHKMVISE